MQVAQPSQDYPLTLEIFRQVIAEELAVIAGLLTVKFNPFGDGLALPDAGVGPPPFLDTDRRTLSSRAREGGLPLPGGASLRHTLIPLRRSEARAKAAVARTRKRVINILKFLYCARNHG